MKKDLDTGAFSVCRRLSRALSIRTFAVALIGLLACAAMTMPLVSQIESGPPTTPTITFTLDFPQSTPNHYSISVDAAGHARYVCTGKVAEDAEEQTYRAEFEISAANRDRIFRWAKEAQYFAGKVDSGNRKLAFTGTKVLSYEDVERSTTARYNYSSLEPVRQLTMLFQAIAGRQEHGWRLAYYHRYQQLAMADELKRMEAQTKNNELAEIQSVSPVLREVAGDASVINVVRARALALIQ